MPNNCYNGNGEPQYYPCGDLLLVDVKFKLEMPLQNGDFEFITTIEDLKSGASCASGNSLSIEFEDDKAWCDGKYKQSLSLVDRDKVSIEFKDVPHDDSVVFEVPVQSLRFARPFTMDDDFDKRGFNNICIEEGGIVATDGHALGVKEWKMGNNCELGYQVPIPNRVADAIIASKEEKVTVSAYIKSLEILNPLNHCKEIIKRVVGVYINSETYSFLVKVENEFNIKGFNHPIVKVTDEPGNFVFDVHENRPKKGRVALCDRQAKAERNEFVDYAWETFKCNAKILLKTLKALDSTHTLLNIHNTDLIVLESWAGKAIVMQME